MSYSAWIETVRHCAVECLLVRSGKRPQNRNKWSSVNDRRKKPRVSLAERLEARLVLSAGLPIASPPISVVPIIGGVNNPSVLTPNVSAPYTPANITLAYGVSAISFQGVSGTGAGQTIAIIDAYNDPNILSDEATFNTHFGLAQFNTAGNPTFTVLNQTGGTTLPANATTANGGWDTEISLDVEWAHAIAPKANIVLFEANSAGGTDLYTAASTAAAYSGVSVVSMSFGSGEFSSESFYDSTFTTPNGHQGVTFLASTGDDNAPAEYPAYSPNVVAVGGTTLSINTNGSWASETAWGNVSSGSGGGGGISNYEPQPSYQAGNVNGLSTTKRTAPDVSMLANVSTGVYMYDSWAGGANNGGYYIAGGTSLACPMWAGLIAIANQDRALSGLGTLDGASQTLPRIYQLPSSDFHDVTSGSNGFNAGTGYDLATGIGTPIANLLVPALAGVTPTASKLQFSTGPTSAAAGAGISPSIVVQVLDTFGSLDTADNSSVTLAFGNNAGSGTLSGTLTVTAVNGVATFSGVSINKVAAGYTLVASDGSLTSATSGSFSITPGAAAQVIITNQPTAASVGVAVSPAVTVTVEDAFGNIATGNSSVVALSLSTGGTFTSGATINVSAVNGAATFSNILIATAGTFTLTASDGSLTTAVSSSFSIAKGTPVVGVTDIGGTYGGVAFGATSAIVNDAHSGATVASFGNVLLSYTYYAGTLAANQIAGATPLGSTPIAAGAYTVVAAYAGSTNYNSASSAPANFTIAQRALHVTAAGQNKIYTGNTSATVTLGDDRVSGDSLTLSYASAAFADKNVNNAIVINVSGISMTGSSSADYTLANTTAATTANITPLTITGSMTATNKTYDNTTAATIAARTLAEVISGDTVSMVGGSAAFNSKDVATATTVTATGLTLTGAQAGDYTLGNTTETAGASITPLAISGNISAGNKVYNGDNSASISTRNLTGVLGSDVVALAGGNATFDSATVDGATSVTATGLTLSGAQATNYSLSNPTESAAASITPLTVTGSFTASSKVYDHTTAATISGRFLTGVLGTDSVSLAGGSATFNSKDVATATTVTAIGFSLSGADSDNYSLGNTTESASATITTDSITAGVIGHGKTYDGSTSAAFTAGTIIGVYSGDIVTLVGGSATFNSKDANSATTITVSGLSLGGAQAGDYSLSNPTETAAATITPLVITGSITAPGKPYDGTVDATISGRSLSGVLNGDDVSLIGGVASFNNKSVTLATTVTATGLSLSGAQAADYSLAATSASVAATLSPLSVSGSITASGKTYDGTTAATISGRSLTGVLANDTVTLAGGSATFNSKDVATAHTVTASGLTLGGAQAGNYALANTTETASATIAPLTVSGSITAAGKVYDGTAAATLSGHVLAGVISNDDVSLILGPATYNSADVISANTVSVTASLGGAQAADYSLSNTTETASAAITPLPLTATVSVGDKTYDGSRGTTISGESLVGVLGSDDVTLSGGVATFNSKDAGVGKTVIVSGLHLSGTRAGDYTLAASTASSTATISPLTINGSFFASNKTYDRTRTALLAGSNLTGVITGDTVSLSGGTLTFDTQDAGIGKAVTATGLTLSGAQAADYSLANPNETAVANITPLAITGSISAGNKIYDGNTAAVITGGSLSGIKAGDEVTLLGGNVANFNSKDVNAANTVTMSGMTLGGADATDYTLANPTESATAHITPLTITASVTAGNKTYDASRTASLTSGQLTGLLGGDNVTLAGGTAMFDTKDVGDAKMITVTGLVLGGPQGADYSLANATETTTGAIAPLGITASITANDKVYDGNASATLATATLNGVFGGDSVTVSGPQNVSFNSADVSTANIVTATGLSIAGPSAGDYILLNSTALVPAAITPLAVSGNITVADKLFDGTTAAVITSRSLSGVLGGDDVALTGGSASFDTPAVDSGKIVTASGFSLSGASAADYSLAEATEATTASISALNITGSVFNDTSSDGTAEAGEAGLAGRTVTLQIAGKGTKGQKTTKTDASGNFVFSNLALGSYVVKATLPAHWRATTLASGATLSLQPGAGVSSLRFGQTNAASVSGVAFLDANRNGKHEASESLLSGWTVLLTANGSSTPTFTTTTAANGSYSFSSVPIGGYHLSIVEPAGYGPSAKSKGSYALSLTALKVISNENFGQQLLAGVKSKHRRAA